MNDAMRRKYMAVLSSPRWRWMKRRIIEVRGNKCEGCGESGGQLDLHHDTYERLGSEKPSDVRLLCRDCHRAEDILRAERGKQKSDDGYYWACVDGFMGRRYGDDWEASFDPSDAAEMYYDFRREYHG